MSVATLVRVLFENPGEGELMLALERRASLCEAEGGQVVEVISQPFGGAIRILDPGRLRNSIGDFAFDSERSRSEGDFRILIRPSAWERVREFCIEHLGHTGDPVLETDPGRELAEEFAEALGIDLKLDQYVQKPVRTVVENDPVPTENLRARGMPTARVYRIFEARVLDTSVTQLLVTNSERLSHQALCERALADAQQGGEGEASAVLALPLKQLTDHYLAASPEARNAPIVFAGHQLDGTVPAILEGISVPRYRSATRPRLRRNALDRRDYR